MPRLPALMLNPNSHNLVLADVTLHALYYSLVITVYVYIVTHSQCSYTKALLEVRMK